jgi:hypothetical protein
MWWQQLASVSMLLSKAYQVREMTMTEKQVGGPSLFCDRCIYLQKSPVIRTFVCFFLFHFWLEKMLTIDALQL